MAMGIDQEIQRRMDAYRGNPQALQQRYQMSQQLLDLLALQKLKAEKDAVARQMQAQMQQQPGTVAQQMEQEMLGRTKQEVAQQVGGVMQQKARQQQQGMARMAQAAARPQGGLGSLAPQTAQSAPRMAGGGIVAFQEGGGPLGQNPLREGMTLTDMQIGLMSNEELVQAANEGKISPEYVKQEIQARVGRSPAERLAEFGELLDKRGEQFITYPIRKIPDILSGAARKAGEAAAVVMGGPESYAGSNAASIPAIIAAVDEYLTTPKKESVPPTPPVITARPGAGTEADQADAAQDNAQTAPPPPEAVEVTERPPLKFTEVKAQTIDEPAGLAALRESLAAQAQEKPRDLKALMEEYGSALGQKERMERRQSRIDELAALDRAQLDPERARKDRLMQVLAAAGGASNIGTMGARMANAAVSSRIRQEQDERARLRQRLAMADEMDTADLGISQEALKNALGTIDSIKTQRIQAMDALSNLARADVDRAEANAKAQYEADVQNNVYRAQEYEAARRAAEDVLDREDASTEQLLSVADQMRQVYDADLERRLALLGQDARYIELMDEAKRTPEEELELQEMKDKAIADAAAYARMADYQGIMKQIEERTKQKFGFDFSR